MGADSKVQAADRPRAVRVRSAAPPTPQERAFWLGLVLIVVFLAGSFFAALIYRRLTSNSSRGKTDASS